MSKASRSIFFPLLLATTLFSCKQEKCTFSPETKLSHTKIVEKLSKNYSQLPEQQIAISNDSSVYAQYINPTTKYAHGILGDQVEAEGLVVFWNERFVQLDLEDNYVFEDIVPRLVDINGDNKPEIICIRTERTLGAGIVIYEIKEDSLAEFAYVKEIGTPNRWLNPVCIYDLDQDGELEIAWIQTPHIGGILKVADITSGEMTSIDEYSTVSNHAIGETNLCLSALIEENDSVKILVPNQSRDEVLTFNFTGTELLLLENESKTIDFSKPIYEQLDYTVFLSDNNCMF